MSLATCAQGWASHFDTLSSPTRAPAPFEHVSTRLNAAQRAAVTLPRTRSALVLAGAGTGKTTTLVERAAWLVRKGVPPGRILLATFTRAAADEMRHRLGALLGPQMPARIGTLHALCLSLMGGGKSLGAQLLSDDLAREALHTLAKQEFADDAQGLTGGELLLQVNRLREERILHHRLAPLAQRWVEHLGENNQLDFVLLLERALTLELPTFSHILVDESQDLTAVQIAVLDHLATPTATRFYVGDDDQSIYGFRGADAGAMSGLAGQGADLIRLEENYRCGRAILDWANNLIAHNTGRFEKQLIACNGQAGYADIEQQPTPSHLERRLDELATHAATQGKSFAILCRTRALLDALPGWEGVARKTLHEAKGLEWDWVAVIGLEEQVLPHRRAESLSEERRLAYVALTRARERLWLMPVGERRTPQTPSRFLQELQQTVVPNVVPDEALDAW